MKRMFFRREQPKNPTFADRLESLRKAGFTTTPQAGGAVRASVASGFRVPTVTWWPSAASRPASS